MPALVRNTVQRVLATAAVLAGTACELYPEAGVSIEGPWTRIMAEGTTVQLVAHVVNPAGAQVAGTVEYVVTEPDAGITVNTTGLVSAVRSGGPWHVTGRLAGRPSTWTTTVAFTVTRTADFLLTRAGDSVVTTSGMAASPAMTVRVFDVPPGTRTAEPVSGIQVWFVVASPVGAGLVLRAEPSTDSTLHADLIMATTDPNGYAATVLAATAVVPDSAVVTAVVRNATGTLVDGSPVRFIVRFQ